MEITTGNNSKQILESNNKTNKRADARSHLRLQYESEVEVIKSKLGSLEEVRQKLGLSRRKMCQLLMVDPSAWTRWNNTGSAPPHIYRSLQWYMALIEKEPIWHPQNSFNRMSGKVSLENEVLILKKQVKELKFNQNLKQAKAAKILLLISVLISAFLLGAFLF